MNLDNSIPREYGVHVLSSFEFEYGKVVEDIKVEYRTTGTPKYDDEGNISNAIIFCPPSFSYGNSVIREAYRYLKKENKFNENEFFFITITSLGIPDSYSPSSTDLRYKFPQYTYKDIVNFKRQFLYEKFKIKHVLGILGELSGGFEVFTWACEYPEDMKFVLILNSDFKISGYRYVMAKGFEAIVNSQDTYYSDDYNYSLSNAMVAINSFMFAQSISKNIMSNLTRDEIEIFLLDYVDEGLITDIYDFNYVMGAFLEYDIEDKLKNIKAKTLIIYSDDTIYFNEPLDIDVIRENIEDLKIISYKSKKENYHDEEDYSLIADEVNSFLKECV